MDNHFKIVKGIDAIRELNDLGYDFPGTTEINSGYISLMLSMAKQIKDLQDIVMSKSKKDLQDRLDEIDKDKAK